MAINNGHSKDMRLVLSSDAKPRLKWTSELHQRFIDAVNQLGGAEKATPKSLMRVMGIHGLTLYHLKSHLQKYRMGRSQQSQTYHQNKQEDYAEKQRSHFTSKNCHGSKEQINEGLQITEALQLQMEVQRKLHEQIEVQRHLQLRIESQGKYLQSVLRKAQETISEIGPCSNEAEHVKAQLSELMSMVDSGCPSSSFSVLTHSEGSKLKDERKKLLEHHGCSLESSLTSSERTWRKDETQPNEVDGKYKQEKECMKQKTRNFMEISLMEMHPVEKNGSESQANERKQIRSADKTTEETNSKRLRLLENIDLNCQTPINDFDLAPRVIDLNSNDDGNL